MQIKPAQGEYGIQSEHAQLALQDTTAKDESRVVKDTRKRLPVLTKCKWALKDQGKFKKLIVELSSYSDNLYRLCPEGAFEAMNIFSIMDF